MALYVAPAAEASGRTLDLRRVVVGFAVVAVHVALIFVMGRATGRHPAESVAITWLTLPITPEPISEPADEISPSPAESSSRTARASTARSDQRRRRKSPREDNTANAVAPEAQSLDEPAAPDVRAAPDEPAAAVDWYAETHATAEALRERENAERQRRSLAGPTPGSSGSRHAKPPCPFEKCEPGWGAGFSVFESTDTKKGRIEKTDDGEVIRWTSNRCYQILVTPNILHRAMTRCIVPLEKSAARGDLFKHMKEAPPPPPDHATDVP